MLWVQTSHFLVRWPRRRIWLGSTALAAAIFIGRETNLAFVKRSQTFANTASDQYSTLHFAEALSDVRMQFGGPVDYEVASEKTMRPSFAELTRNMSDYGTDAVYIAPLQSLAPLSVHDAGPLQMRKSNATAQRCTALERPLAAQAARPPRPNAQARQTRLYRNSNHRAPRPNPSPLAGTTPIL